MTESELELFSFTMDYSDDNLPPDFAVDETVAYEDQVPNHSANDPERGALVNRIGSTKIYLLAELSMARVGKVRW